MNSETWDKLQERHREIDYLKAQIELLKIVNKNLLADKMRLDNVEAWLTGGKPAIWTFSHVLFDRGIKIQDKEAVSYQANGRTLREAIDQELIRKEIRDLEKKIESDQEKLASLQAEQSIVEEDLGIKR